MRSRFAARAGRLTAVASSRCRLRFSRLEHANSFEAGDWLAGWSRADSNIGPDSVTNAVYLYAASGCTTNVLERYVDGTERNVSYTWTDDYRLASVSVDGEPAAEYAYDVLGNLVAVANDEESFEILVDNGHSLAGVAADGRTLRVYMRAPGVDNWLGFVDMTGNLPVPYFYVTDHLGSVLAVTDANGNVVERYEYDAWGKVLSVTDANGNALTRSAIGNRILWQAREYSWTTGLYYFRNRWYDPVIGRWISKDPIGIDGGVNLYEFCEGNPIAFLDFSGEGKIGIAIRLGKWGVKVIKNISKDSAKRIYSKRKAPDLIVSKQTLKKMSKQKGFKKPRLETHSDEYGRGSPHYHPPGRKTIYGQKGVHGFVTKKFTAVGLWGDHWYTQGVDFFNPMSDVSDILGLIDEWSDDEDNEACDDK